MFSNFSARNMDFKNIINVSLKKNPTGEKQPRKYSEEGSEHVRWSGAAEMPSLHGPRTLGWLLPVSGLAGRSLRVATSCAQTPVFHPVAAQALVYAPRSAQGQGSSLHTETMLSPSHSSRLPPVPSASEESPVWVCVHACVCVYVCVCVSHSVMSDSLQPP